jgi:hypothetical protein
VDPIDVVLVAEIDDVLGGLLTGSAGAGVGGTVDCRIGFDLDLETGSGTFNALEAALDAGRLIVEGEAMNCFFSYFA